MAVTLDSRVFRAKLRAALDVIPRAAAAAINNAAVETLDAVKNATRASWDSHTQVGFDLENFIRIIDKVTVIQGGLGILDTSEMGTAEDLEKIRGVPGLWHQGTRAGDRFGLFYNQQFAFFDQVAELADRRNIRWSDTEPQWWLLEYGTLGTGAYDPRPPSNAINGTVLRSIPRVWSIVDDTVSRMLRQRGITV